MKRPDGSNPKSLGYKFRKKRFEKIERMIRDTLKHQSSVSILDVGGRRDYWDYLEDDLHSKTHITLVNYETELSEFTEKNSNLNMTSLIGDGCNMPQFADDSFDIAHSNSVIEHVGSLSNMIKYADEIRRVGKKYYVQAPYLWFPIDPHFGMPFIHWLPGPSRALIMHKYKVGFSNTPIKDYREALSEADSIRLVDKALIKRLFPESKLSKERFCLLTKSLICVKN